MSYTLYGQYKDSNIDWIKKIPIHWMPYKLKHVINEFIAGGTPKSSNDSYWDENNDGIPWVAIGDMNDNDYINSTAKNITIEGLASKNLRILKKGTLIYSIFASLGKTSILNIDATTNQAILGLILSNKIDTIYLKYYLVALQTTISSFSNENTQENLNLSIVKNMEIAIPISLEEQKQIAKYLNKKTSKIDETIAKNKELIKLLEEKRVTLINYVVTKGLNPDVPMKDSGIDIVGLIPKNNNIIRLKFLCDIKTGDKDTVNRNPEGKYPFYVRSPIIERIDTYSFEGEAVLMAGDGVGAGKVFHYANGKFDYHQRVYNLHNFKKVSPEFIYYYMSSLFSLEIEKGSAKSTVDSVRLPMLENFLICYPPINEQENIVNYLNFKTSKIDNAISKIEDNIKLLEEYKTSLIHHVVTGKIDVRGEEI